MHGALVRVSSHRLRLRLAASGGELRSRIARCASQIFGNARKMRENITIGLVSAVIASAGRQSWATSRCRFRLGDHRPDLAVVPLVIVGAGEVTGFLFGLLLLCPHTIELRPVQHDLDCIVPAQIAVLIEDGANLLLSSFPEPRFRCPRTHPPSS